MNLGIPAWGNLTRERMADSDGFVRDDFLIPLPQGDSPEDYFTLDEYADFSWKHPSTVFFFSGGLFTFRMFSAVVKSVGHIVPIDAVIQEFVSSVHENSMLPKSDKATKLARELKPLRRVLDELEFNEVDASRVILAYIIQNPVCPTLDSMEEFIAFAFIAKERGARHVLDSSIADYLS